MITDTELEKLVNQLGRLITNTDRFTRGHLVE